MKRSSIAPQRVIVGRPLPWLLPFCASCKQMCEGYTKHPPREDGKFELEARCHGKTSSVIVDDRYLQQRWFEGKPLVMFGGPLRRMLNVVVAKHAR